VTAETKLMLSTQHENTLFSDPYNAAFC